MKFAHTKLRQAISMATVAATASLMALLLVTVTHAQVPQDNNEDRGVLILILVVLIVYFIPTIVAFRRKHPNRWTIGVINTVFGGTGLGWLGSLVWSLNAVHKSADGGNGGESGLNLFVNDPVKVELTQGAAPPGQSSAMEQLHKLKSLHEQGVIDDAEFTRLKAPLLEALLK